MSQKVTTQVGAGQTILSPTMNIIEVDTSDGAVELIMPTTSEIRRILGTMPISFIISDVTGNAATNNITIKPSINSSEVLNGAASQVINTNNGGASLKPIYGIGYFVDVLGSGGGGSSNIRVVSKSFTAAELIALAEGDSNEVNLPFTSVTLTENEYISATKMNVIILFKYDSKGNILTIDKGTNTLLLYFNETSGIGNIVKIQDTVGNFYLPSFSDTQPTEIESEYITIILGSLFTPIPINTLTQGSVTISFIIQNTA